MNDNQTISFALDSFIENEISSDFNDEKIVSKLRTLFDHRAEPYKEEMLTEWVKTFKSMGWNTKYILKKIADLRCSTLRRKIRFCDFITEDDYSMINYELVKMEAQAMLVRFMNKLQ